MGILISLIPQVVIDLYDIQSMVPNGYICMEICKGIKYTSCEHNTKHLLNTLKWQYTLTKDWSGCMYCGITLHWDSIICTVDFSKYGYIDNALNRFQHPTPSKPQHSPHNWMQSTYGANLQYAPYPDDTDPLEPPEITRIEQITGTFVLSKSMWSYNPRGHKHHCLSTVHRHKRIIVTHTKIQQSDILHPR
jgi:hypothetical protein